MKLYRLELGVLWDEDNEDVEYYKNVYDHKHGYYNEDCAFSFHKEELERAMETYVTNGVINTYGIITEYDFEFSDFNSDYEVAYDFMKQIVESWYLEDWVGWLQTVETDIFSTDIIVKSVYKNETGKLIYDFVERG